MPDNLYTFSLIRYKNKENIFSHIYSKICVSNETRGEHQNFLCISCNQTSFMKISVFLLTNSQKCSSFKWFLKLNILRTTQWFRGVNGWSDMMHKNAKGTLALPGMEPLPFRRRQGLEVGSASIVPCAIQYPWVWRWRSKTHVCWPMSDWTVVDLTSIAPQRKNQCLFFSLFY